MPRWLGRLDLFTSASTRCSNSSSRGKLNKQIADTLGISIKTVGFSRPRDGEDGGEFAGGARAECGRARAPGASLKSLQGARCPVVQHAVHDEMVDSANERIERTLSPRRLAAVRQRAGCTVSARLGLPLLLLFLVVGMLAGEDGPGGIRFDDFAAATLIGHLALAVILLDGGLHTVWPALRCIVAPPYWRVGVVATALVLESSPPG